MKKIGCIVQKIRQRIGLLSCSSICFWTTVQMNVKLSFRVSLNNT